MCRCNTPLPLAIFHSARNPHTTMKTFRTILFLLSALCIAQVMRGAEPPKPIGGKQANVQIQQKAATPQPKAPATLNDYIASISVSPYGTIVHDGIGDGESYGAGLALGLHVNAYVSIELSATTYSDNDWRDEAIDESAVLGRFRLVRNAAETVSIYGLAGGDRDWGRHDWALSVGGGIQLKLHERIALFADSRIRAWFNGHDDKTKDIATRAGVGFSF